MDEFNRDWLTEREVDAFVGKNADYYKEKWKSNPKSDYYKGWNIIALFFFFEWAAYRKMYREAIGAFLSIVIFTIFFTILPVNSDLIVKLFGQLVKILFCAFANGFYRKKALRTLQKTFSMDEYSKMDYLTKQGGTSVISLIIFLLLEISLYLLTLTFA